jgi:hypothetical protein
MATKTCPSCDADVPVVATRCKSCFFDFNEKPPAKSNGAMGLLLLFAAMGAVGLGVFWYLSTQVATERVVVDEETQTIIITRKSSTKTEATRVAFGDVEKIEYLLGGGAGTYSITAVGKGGERHLIQASDDSPLQARAQHIAKTMKKPLDEVRAFKTFGD